MSALSIIESAGFVVTLVDDAIEVTATKSDLTDKQRDYIRTNKQEIMRELASAQLNQDIREQIEERAAIMEYDGGLTRKDAEQAAAAAMRVYCYKTTEKPNSELTVIMPGTELDEAIEDLKNKFGDRLLDVYPMEGTITEFKNIEVEK